MGGGGRQKGGLRLLDVRIGALPLEGQVRIVGKHLLLALPLSDVHESLVTHIAGEGGAQQNQKKRQVKQQNGQLTSLPHLKIENIAEHVDGQKQEDRSEERRVGKECRNRGGRDNV